MMRQGCLYRQMRGFTLMELLVVMALSAITMAMAIPAFDQMLMRTRVTASTNTLLGILQSGRYKALAERQPLTFCSVGRGQVCEIIWRERFLLFADKNRNGVRDEGDKVALDTNILADGFTLVWHGFRSQRFMQWESHGMSSASNGTFTLCNIKQHEEWLRQVVVNRAGRPRVVYPAREGGIILREARSACGW